MKILKVYDNEGKSFDRYTVVVGVKQEQYECLGLSLNPDSPQGFSQWGLCILGEHLGKEVNFEDLPKNVRIHILNRLREED